MIRCQSPLRLSLAGGGTDVEPFSSQYGSSVLNFAINYNVEGTLGILDSKNNLPSIQLSIINANKTKSENKNTSRSKFEISLEQNLNKLFGDLIKRSLVIELHSPVGPGSGLGASSSMVATAILLIKSHLFEPTNPYSLAEDALDLERNKMHLSGGFQDQFISAFGGILFLNKETVKVEVEKLRLNKIFLKTFEESLLLIDLGVSRSGETIIDKQITNVKNEKASTIQALKEQRTIAKRMRLAMIEENLLEVASLMQRAWQSKKQFALEISNEQINNSIEDLLDLGALGVKVSGAGGGGHLLCMSPVDFNVRKEIQSYLQACQLDYRSVRINEKGSFVWM